MKETGRAESRKQLDQQRDDERHLAVETATARRSALNEPDARISTSGQMLTINEVARLLRLHPTTVYRLAKKGALPAFKIGYSWRFDSEDLNRWRSEQYRSPNR